MIWESFPILRFAQVTFQNLSIFCIMFNLNDATILFFCLITLTKAFYDSVSKKQLMHKFWKNDIFSYDVFQKYEFDVTMMTLSIQNQFF